MSPKPILFVDFDGTLCFDKYWRSLSPEQYAKVQKLIFGPDKSILSDWMKGKCTAEEVNALVAEELGVSPEFLWELFVRDCSTMEVSGEILEKLNNLRKQYRVILITGNMDSFTRFTVPSLRLDKFFDHINNSFFDGRLKSDKEGEIFIEYAEVFGAPLNQCVLIDNSAHTCEVFGRLGGTPCLITPEKGIAYYLSLLS